MLIDGKKRCMNSRKYCIECSPFNAHNTAKLHTRGSKSNNYIVPVDKLCTTCNKIKLIDGFYSSRGKIHGNVCKECFNAQSMQKQRDRKSRMISCKGNACLICGYNTSHAGLCFHHVDPTKKDRAAARLLTHKWDKIQPELDKCVLLCIRCHAELHHSHLSEHHQKIVDDYFNKGLPVSDLNG